MYKRQVETSDDGTVEMVATPVDFSISDLAVRDLAPFLGQHTELVLHGLGIDWDRIEELKELGIIP